MAERHLGVPIQKAVISVPAEFDERQRNYTIRAADLAGQFSNCFMIKLDMVLGHLIRHLSVKPPRMLVTNLSLSTLKLNTKMCGIFLTHDYTILFHNH